MGLPRREILGPVGFLVLLFFLTNARYRGSILLILGIGGLMWLLWWLWRSAPVSEPQAARPVPEGEGEQRVRYALQWLDKEQYRVMEQVRLRALPYGEERFSYLVAGPSGIFNLAPRVFAGQVEIDPSGVWTESTGGQPVRIESPVFQLQRQRRILESLLDPSVHVYDVIVLADDKTLIEGQHNCPVPIVTVDMLLHQIQSQLAWQYLSPEEVEAVCAKLMAAAQ